MLLLLTVGVGAEDLSLAALRSSGKAHMLMSWTLACPCCREGEERLLRLQQQYPDVRVSALHSSPFEKAEDVQAYLQSHNLALPVLFDRGGTAVRFLQVKTTATAMIWDRFGELVYVGTMEGAETALAQLREGTPVAPHSTPQKGCAIPSW